MSDDEKKLKALGRMQLDSSPSSLRDISSDLTIPYSKLLRWRKELEQATEDGDIASLVNAEQLLVHRVAEEIKQDIQDVAPSEGELITKEVDAAIDGVDGFQVLNQRLQTTALSVAAKIDHFAKSCTNPKDLAVLVDALAKMQVAFFNKNVTNVNVLNQNGTGPAFEGFKKKP